MGKTRLEAFSDGVLAIIIIIIIITIMVLELKVPHEPSWHALLERWPVFLSYLLSFVFIGIYWGNHHHLLHSARKVTPGVLWANLHLLFWLSLVPFVTDCLGETRAEHVPTAVYGVVMVASGVAYQVLQSAIARQQTDAPGREAHARSTKKGLFAMAAYFSAIALAFVAPVASVGLYVLVALVWVVPDRTFERVAPHAE